MRTTAFILTFLILFTVLTGGILAQDFNSGSTASTTQTSTDICGDGICGGGEGILSCPTDCDICGDGICSISETIASCPEDCSVCGDRYCSGIENVNTCPNDCKVVDQGPSSYFDPKLLDEQIRSAQKNIIIVVLIAMACLGMIFGMFLIAKHSRRKEEMKKTSVERIKIQPKQPEVINNETNRSQLENEQNKQ